MCDLDWNNAYVPEKKVFLDPATIVQVVMVAMDMVAVFMGRTSFST